MLNLWQAQTRNRWKVPSVLRAKGWNNVRPQWHPRRLRQMIAYTTPTRLNSNSSEILLCKLHQLCDVPAAENACAYTCNRAAT